MRLGLVLGQRQLDHWRVTDQYDTAKQVSVKGQFVRGRDQSGGLRGFLLTGKETRKEVRLGIIGGGLGGCKAVHGDGTVLSWYSNFSSKQTGPVIQT